MSTLEYNFSGKKFVVTGAGRGFGRNLVERLNEYGAIIYAVSIECMEELSKTCQNMIPVRVDLRDWAGTKEALAKAIGDVKIDGIVNNAGVGALKSIYDLTEDDYELTFDVNVKAVFHVTQSLLPFMADGGSIVNVASISSLRSFDCLALYNASKAAVDALTRSFAKELGPRHIRSNSINPTAVLTPMGIPYWNQERTEMLKSRTPFGRFAEVHEITDGILFLLSDRAAFINGHSLPIDGGFLAC